MSDYFHEAMVAKMVNSNGYEQGYGVGFSSGYAKGRIDVIDKVLPLIKDIRGLCRDDVYIDLITRVEQLKEQNV